MKDRIRRLAINGYNKADIRRMLGTEILNDPGLMDAYNQGKHIYVKICLTQYYKQYSNGKTSIL